MYGCCASFGYFYPLWFQGLEFTEQLVKELKEAGMYYSKSMDVNTKLCQENLL